MDVVLPLNVPDPLLDCHEMNPFALPATGLFPDSGAAAIAGPQIVLFWIVMPLTAEAPIEKPQPQYPSMMLL